MLQFNKLTSVFLCVCPVIDHEFRHHIVRVAVHPRGDSRVDPQTTVAPRYNEPRYNEDPDMTNNI